MDIMKFTKANPIVSRQKYGKLIYLKTENIEIIALIICINKTKLKVDSFDKFLSILYKRIIIIKWRISIRK
jgi:hypothetical protein